MNRLEVTEKIISTKVSKGIKWEDVAKKVGESKEWTTALCLGQMTATAAQAKVVGKIFGLNAEEQKWLQVVPYKGSLPTPVPTDPLIYRWYEIVSVYGTTIKELIHEEFGDGIMSAIDFSMDIQRQADPKGDRVNVVLSGKFLPYKTYLTERPLGAPRARLASVDANRVPPPPPARPGRQAKARTPRAALVVAGLAAGRGQAPH